MRLSGILVLATALVFGTSGCGVGDESESDGEVGAAASAVLSASTTSVVFTSVPALCYSYANVTISNPGSSSETINYIRISNTAFTWNGLPHVIAGGSYGTLHLTFHPPSAGTFTGTVTINSTDGAGITTNLIINVQGTGFPPGPC